MEEQEKKRILDNYYEFLSCLSDEEWKKASRVQFDVLRERDAAAARRIDRLRQFGDINLRGASACLVVIIWTALAFVIGMLVG